MISELRYFAASADSLSYLHPCVLFSSSTSQRKVTVYSWEVSP